MTKTTKIIITIMALFAVTSCRGAANPAANANNAEICTFPVEIHQVNPARPGDTLFLSPNIDQNLFGWVFHWDSPEGFLRDADTISPALIVPDGVEIVEVSLDVTDNAGCVGFGSLQIEVIPPPTAEATEIAADESDSEPTPADPPVATLEPTEQPTEAATLTTEPNEMATATLEPSQTPQPTLTLQPTFPPISDPVITRLEALPGGTIVVEWAWDGVLLPTQNFAVRFWSEMDPRPEARFSITWTKGYSYSFEVNSTEFPVGTYLVNVAVMEGPSEGVHYELAESTDEPVFVDADPPPPTPPIP